MEQEKFRARAPQTGSTAYASTVHTPIPKDHPEPADLERFFQGRLSHEEARNVVAHLLTRCPRCLQETRRLWRFGDEPLLKRRPGRELALDAAGLGMSGAEDEAAFWETH